MEKVRPWCGQPSDRGRLRNRTKPAEGHFSGMNKSQEMRPLWLVYITRASSEKCTPSLFVKNTRNVDGSWLIDHAVVKPEL